MYFWPYLYHFKFPQWRLLLLQRMIASELLDIFTCKSFLEYRKKSMLKNNPLLWHSSAFTALCNYQQCNQQRRSFPLVDRHRRLNCRKCTTTNFISKWNWHACGCVTLGATVRSFHCVTPDRSASVSIKHHLKHRLLRTPRSGNIDVKSWLSKPYVAELNRYNAFEPKPMNLLYFHSTVLDHFMQS